MMANSEGLRQRVIVAVSAAILVLLALSGTFLLVLSSQAYIASLQAETGTPSLASPPLGQAEASVVAGDVAAYVKGELGFLPSSSYFRPGELSHLDDVRERIFAVKGLVFFLAASAIALIWWVVKGRSGKVLPALSSVLLPSGVGMLLLVVIGFLLSLSFEASFAGFHQLLFGGSQWQFPPGYLLVNLFTIGFFSRFATVIMTLLLAEAVLFAAAGMFIRRRGRGVWR